MNLTSSAQEGKRLKKKKNSCDTVTGCRSCRCFIRHGRHKALVLHLVYFVFCFFISLDTTLFQVSFFSSQSAFRDLVLSNTLALMEAYAAHYATCIRERQAVAVWIATSKSFGLLICRDTGNKGKRNTHAGWPLHKSATVRVRNAERGSAASYRSI